MIVTCDAHDHDGSRVHDRGVHNDDILDGIHDDTHDHANSHVDLPKYANQDRNNIELHR